MLKRIKQENKKIVEEWERERKVGFLRYYLKKIIQMGIFVGVFMCILYVINTLIGQTVDYIRVAIVYSGIAIFIPILAWVINEVRYKMTKNTE